MRAPLLVPLLLLGCSTAPGAPSRPPSIVLIVADDLGYGDLSCYGGSIPTPRLDRMAREGRRLTSFVVAQAVCTASRAALMSGCYPQRIGLHGALNHDSRNGIGPALALLPEVLKARGYATACFGKWHLGHQPPFLPTRNGFDEFRGIPYSNDNGPLHPVMRGLPPLPVYEGEKIVETDPDQALFTRWITDRGLDFIRRNRERPYFLYLPHVMPHVPIRARTSSGRGLYADVVMELDAAVGEILDAAGDDALVVFMSDNGPFLSYGEHAGSARPLREGKLTTYEGGHRVPFLARWPGRVPAGVVDDGLAAGMDLIATFAELAGAPTPPTAADAVSLAPLLLGPAGTPSPRASFLYYSGTELQAVRKGAWKLHLEHEYLTVAGPPGKGGKPANVENMKPMGMDQSGIRGIASRHGYRVEKQSRALYDLKADPGETRDVGAGNPDRVDELLRLAR
jgi:arylsulfatase